MTTIFILISSLLLVLGRLLNIKYQNKSPNFLLCVWVILSSWDPPLFTLNVIRGNRLVTNLICDNIFTVSNYTVYISLIDIVLHMFDACLHTLQWVLNRAILKLMNTNKVVFCIHLVRDTVAFMWVCMFMKQECIHKILWD